MRITIQIALLNGWDKNPPVLHDVSNLKEAETICYALSHQFGNATVRMCVIPDNVMIWDISPEYVSRCNGNYIQAKRGNARWTNEYVEKLINK